MRFRAPFTHRGRYAPAPAIALAAGTRVGGTARFTAVTTPQETGQVITCDTGTIRYTAKD